MRGETFSIYGIQIPRKCIKSVHFYSSMMLHLRNQNSRQNFWKTFFPYGKEVDKIMICFIKSQSKNMKTNWNVTLFIFCVINNFF